MTKNNKGKEYPYKRKPVAEAVADLRRVQAAGITVPAAVAETGSKGRHMAHPPAGKIRL